MLDTSSVSQPRLVLSLARLAKRHPVERKLVIAPTVAGGRELLQRMALEGVGWIGFDVATPERIASRLARQSLEAAGLRLMDGFDQQALLDEALDGVPGLEQMFGELAELVGFRTAVHRAVRELRAAGLGSADVDRGRLYPQTKKRLLVRVLGRYERLLQERRVADAATTIALALETLEREGHRLPASLDAEVLVCLPGLATRGLSGRLLSALRARGARVLDSEAVLGLEVPKGVLWHRNASIAPGSLLNAEPDATAEVAPPQLHLFRAGSVEAELREVLRRVIQAGVRWDHVEIVASDPALYGSVMHGLATRLGVPVTYAVGLPVGRTRAGRVVRTYLDWIAEGFPADPIRRLLEAGDLRPPTSKGNHPPAVLARRFRSLRIGWGRLRYRRQLQDTLSAIDRMRQDHGESDERFARRKRRTRSELEALRSILFPTLRMTPGVPDRATQTSTRVSPAEIARGLRAFLRRVPFGKGPDRLAREEIGRVLERIEATCTRRTEFRAAVATVRRHLDIRVRAGARGAADEETVAPWTSEAGAIHLTDLAQGGYSGRTVVFMVGLDVERLTSGAMQDPILLDSDRRILGPDLPTSSEVARERNFDLAALVARSRGPITMSFCAWDPAQARRVGASPLLLQALRMAERNDRLTFEDLDERLGRVVAAVPPPDRSPLDETDVWMRALARTGALQLGRSAVRAVFADLDAGVRARERRGSGEPGPDHGVLSAVPDGIDPRAEGGPVLSASALESLGACPLRYLQARVLRIVPPDDPQLDPDVWLDASHRGRLLHDVFEQAMGAVRSERVRVHEDAFEELVATSLRERLERLRLEVPVPGEGILAREVAGLEEDVRSFVRLVRELQPEPMAVELRFGFADAEPVEITVRGGHLRVRGAVDRVDRKLSGLQVVDYKTGAPRMSPQEPFRGGRQVQHALYAKVVEQLLDQPVLDAQYHFATRRGQNRIVAFDPSHWDGFEDLVGDMLDGVASGRFVPTDDGDDCRFCDFAEICRVRPARFGVVAPLADWSKAVQDERAHPAFEGLARVRAYE